MITASDKLHDIFYESRTVKSGAGCTVEYNMNEMLDHIIVSTSITDQQYINTITPVSAAIPVRKNPFRKLFPIDSVVKPNRPTNSGIKYYILRDSDHLNNPFYDYRNVPYPSASPRVYYPGVNTEYKYWISPAGVGVNLGITYVVATAQVTKIIATGESESGAGDGKVIYTCYNDHGFRAGDRITISGSSNVSFNLTNKVIEEVTDSKTFVIKSNISQSIGGPELSGVIASLVNSSGTPTPSKPALSNKIVVKFEKYHTLPSSCTFTITYNGSNTPETPVTVSIPSNSNGIVNLYYNGTAWSGNPPFTSSQPISYPAPRQIKSIVISTPAAGIDGIIGVIEVSARWIKDISLDLLDFTIEKESTSNPQDILPVGNITANSLNLNLVKYDKPKIKILDYNRDLPWTVDPIPNDVIYCVKNMEVKPYFKIYHDLGAVIEGSIKYDIINQGTFYADSYNISQYGETAIECLDGSRHLMLALCPDLIYNEAPITAVIMSLLDSIGFSNYNINIKLDENGESIDTSIPNVKSWWTEDSTTIWNALQELCRDSQINAFFDENNVLQICTRDYLYNRDTIAWEFQYDSNGTHLPNIITFDKKEVLMANQVKVLWRVPQSSLYTQSAGDLWTAEDSYLIAGALRNDISASDPAEHVDFDIDISELDPYVKFQATSSFNGYFLINSEIFQYDAIQYAYTPLNSTTKKNVWISSQGDWSKYRYLSKTGSDYFKPTGKFRIIRRGVFETPIETHIKTGGSPADWKLVEEDSWT